MRAAASLLLLLLAAPMALAQQTEWRRATASGEVEIVDAPAPNCDTADQASWRGRDWPYELSSEAMVHQPSAQEVEALHPERARHRGQKGAVIMEGCVGSDGTLSWRVQNAYPTGWGFEEAAIRAGALYEAPLRFPDGRPTAGSWFVAVIAFTAPQPRPRWIE